MKKEPEFCRANIPATEQESEKKIEKTTSERIAEAMEGIRKEINKEKGIMLFISILNGKIIMSSCKEGRADMAVLLSNAAGKDNDIAKALVTVASVNYHLATEVLNDFIEVYRPASGKEVQK